VTVQLTYQGADGSVWNLTNGGNVFVDQRGVEGLGNPTWNRQTLESAGSDGQRRTGQRSRAKARQGYLPCILSADTPDGWFPLSAAWWNAWDTDTTGRLTVTMPDGTARFLDVCLMDDDSYAPTTDPSITGVEVVGVHWVADQPFWLGPQQTAYFDVQSDTTTTTTPDFFNAGAAPPFYLAKSTTTVVNADTTTLGLTNSGDVDAWPVYTFVGPITSFSATINGHTIAGTLNCPSGSTVVIDTDPARQTAFLYTGTVATNITPSLTAVDFAPIPKGGAATISASVVGSGSLTVTFYPRYKRAW